MTAIACYAYLDLDGRGYILEDEYVEAPLREDMARFSAALPLYCFWGTPDYIDLDVHGRVEPIDSGESDTSEDPVSSGHVDSEGESIRKKMFQKFHSRLNVDRFRKLARKTKTMLNVLRIRKHPTLEEST